MKETIIKMATTNIGSLCIFLKNKKNINYLDYMNSHIPIQILDRNMAEKVYYIVNDIKDPIVCKCGSLSSFIGFKNGYRPTCGKRECYVNLRRETCIKRYGVDNPKKSSVLIEKEKDNILKKWNGKHYMLDDKIRKKFKNTMVNNWGVEWSQQNKTISEKSRKTFSENPNKAEIINNRKQSLLKSYENNKEEIIYKRMSTINEKWGRHYMLDDGIREKRKNHNFKKYGVDHHLKNK